MDINVTNVITDTLMFVLTEIQLLEEFAIMDIDEL